jgi:hypothetical protein
LAVAPPARATLARALRLDELVARSRHVLVGEPLEAYSVWETIGDRKHIVTYHRVRTLELFAGVKPEHDELLVRTLGGRVGKLGELVAGEAQLSPGARGVLFVAQAREVLAVTAMAQGHYPLARDAAGAERLRRSAQATDLLSVDGSAVKRLHGLSLGDARTLLRSAVPR